MMPIGWCCLSAATGSGAGTPFDHIPHLACLHILGSCLACIGLYVGYAYYIDRTVFAVLPTPKRARAKWSLHVWLGSLE